MPTHAGWKGKKRAVDINNRDEGGVSGIVLSLDNGGSDAIYTLPVKVGATNQQFSLQVDTGSSDLWIASTSCTTSSCNSAKGHLYDPSSASATGANFNISYFSGSAAGPIVWDSVTIGGYTIDNQALAAVNSIQSEPLAPNFSGVLGIALPHNSIIAFDVPPVTSNSRDGAVWVSNLFSINTAPSFHFLSLALSRPGSKQVQSVLGIGEHPTALVPNPSLIQYSTIDASGARFWEATVRAITVYVNGVAKQVQLGTSNTGAAFLNAVLDSGTPLIFTTTSIANAIYGSIGITPAADGMYYVPCTTPLNMTITLDNRSATPLHPLDLTAEPPQGNSAQFCTGLIQTADDQLSNPDSNLKADIVLGVPFMRNVYTVMAYSVPNSNGSFTAVNNSDGGLSQTITPRLGLMSLTDPTKALQEFHNVRVLNQPMDGPSNTSSHNAPVGEKTLPPGIIVLIGLLSFLGLCGVLFASRWFLLRRAQRKAVARQSTDDDKVAYMLTRTSPSRRERAAGIHGREGFSEDELRKMKFEAHVRKQKKKILSLSTMSSDRTRVANYEGSKYGRLYDDPEGMEFGQLSLTRKATVDEDLVWDAATGLDWGDDTLTQHPPRAYEIPPEPPESEPGHIHLPSEPQNLTAVHRRNPSLAMQPLLTSVPENNLGVEDYEDYTQPNTSSQRLHHSFITNIDS